MSEDINSPIDRFFSAVDLIFDQLNAGNLDIADYVRKYDSLITLNEVISGKRHENPIKAEKYLKAISELYQKITERIMSMLGFTVLDRKRIFPLFIKLMQNIDESNK